MKGKKFTSGSSKKMGAAPRSGNYVKGKNGGRMDSDSVKVSKAVKGKKSKDKC